MNTYRITDAVGLTVASGINPEYKAYQIMVPISANSISWKPLKPSNAELNKQDWYSPWEFMDPNEVNTKMGLPPNYIVLNRKNEKLLDWVKKNFKVKEIIKNSKNDIVFRGEWIHVNTTEVISKKE